MGFEIPDVTKGHVAKLKEYGNELVRVQQLIADEENALVATLIEHVLPPPGVEFADSRGKIFQVERWEDGGCRYGSKRLKLIVREKLSDGRWGNPKEGSIWRLRNVPAIETADAVLGWRYLKD